VVNIKDDPEVVMASTSAVNVDEAGQDFGGEDYDESYDGYYEDDGAEMGDGAEGTDGTKGFEGQYFDEFRPEMVFVREDGRFQCTLCESILCQMSVARTHVIQKHVVPEYFKCKICQATVKHRMSLSQHLNRKHHIKKANKTIIQNTFQKFKKTSIIQNYL